MIIWLQNKAQKGTKVFALVLFLLCSQLSLASHVHAENDVALEACSVCLVGQSAEFDDVILPSVNHKPLITNFGVYTSTISAPTVFDQSPISLHLRGPPA